MKEKTDTEILDVFKSTEEELEAQAKEHIAEVETEIAKINENMKKYEENATNLQIDWYVKVNGARDPERMLPSDEEIEEEEKLENELAKEIGLSFIRLKNKNTKIVIESTSKNKIIKFFI